MRARDGGAPADKPKRLGTKAAQAACASAPVKRLRLVKTEQPVQLDLIDWIVAQAERAS